MDILLLRFQGVLFVPSKVVVCLLSFGVMPNFDLIDILLVFYFYFKKRVKCSVAVDSILMGITLSLEER